MATRHIKGGISDIVAYTTKTGEKATLSSVEKKNEGGSNLQKSFIKEALAKVL